MKRRFERTQDELSQVQHENAALREALEASQRQVLELSKWQPNMQPLTSVDSAPSQDAGPDPELFAIPADRESYQENVNVIENSDVRCSCNSNLSWGCPLHRVYSNSVLLAHRDIAAKIAQGPPGLSMSAPPGLDGLTNSPLNMIRTA